MDAIMDLKPEDRVEYWELVLSEFKESGLTRSEYCSQNDIKISTFDYWKRRIADMNACNNENGSRFVELKLTSSSGNCSLTDQTNKNTNVFNTEMVINVGQINLFINRNTPMDFIRNVLRELANA